MTTKPYSILLADDHALVRRGIRKIIEENPDLQVVGEAGDGQELLDCLLTLSPRPDLVIMGYLHAQGGRN